MKHNSNATQTLRKSLANERSLAFRKQQMSSKSKSRSQASLKSDALGPIRIEQLLWVDACSEIGWAEADNKVEPFVAYTVGRVIKETPKYIVLIGSWGASDTDTNERMVIPKGWIVSRKRLK